MAKKAKIKDLKSNLFVRSSLDQDWALQLGALLEAGVKLPPIKVTSDFTVVDGRHRIEAHELNQLDEIEYEIVSVKDEFDLIAQAYKANLGGSLPPRVQDTEHTIRLLLQRNVNGKAIGEMLGLPPSIARKYASNIRSKDERAKVQRAAMAVTEGGLTITKAAETHDADEDKVREVLGGRTRKHKKGIEEVQRGLTKLYRSLSSKNGSLMKNLFEKYEDGDVSMRQVLDVFKHIEDLNKKQVRNLLDWRKRFNAVNGKPAAKQPVAKAA